MANKTQILVELLLKAQNDIGPAVDSARKAVTGLGPAVDVSGRQMVKGFKEAETAAKGMGSAFGGIKAGLAGLLAGVSIGAVASAIKGVVNEIDALRDKATTLNIPVDQLAGLEFAAKQSDASVEDLVTAIRSMSNVIDGALTGNEAAAKALDRLGLSAQRLAAVPVKEALLLTFDAIQKMPAGVQRNAAAMDVLGRSYQSLIPLMAEGRAGIAAMAAEQAALNPVSQAGADKMDGLNDALGRAAESAKGLAASIALLAIDSGLISLIDRITSAVSALRNEMTAGGRKHARGGGMQGFSDASFWPTDEDMNGPDQTEKSMASFTEAVRKRNAELRTGVSLFFRGAVGAKLQEKAALDAVVHEDQFGKLLREKNERESSASASRIASAAESAAKASANRIKQIQGEALTYIAGVREKDLEKTVAGLRTLEAEHVAKYANIGLAAADLEKLKLAVAAETNGKIKELQADAFKAYMEEEKKAYDATVKRHEAQLKAAQDTLEATERSISRTTELANLRAQIDADLGRTGAAGTEASAHQIAMEDLAARRASILQSATGIPDSAVGDEQRRANAEAMLALQHESAMETEKHNAAMIRLGSSTQSWAEGAATAFQAWRDQHSAFNTAAQAMTQAIDGIASATSNFVMGIVTGAQKGKDAFKQFAAGLIKMLGEIMIKALMTAAVMAMIGIVFPAAPVAAAGIGAASQAGAASTRGGAFGVIGSVLGGGAKASPSIMPLPGGKPSMGGGADKGAGVTYNIYNVEATDADSFARKMMERPAQDVLTGTMAKNLRGNSQVRGAARG